MNLDRAAQVAHAASSAVTVIFNADGPTGASTSTPASANHARPSRPRNNSSLRPSHSPSMPVAPPASNANQLRRAGLDHRWSERNGGRLSVSGGRHESQNENDRQPTQASLKRRRKLHCLQHTGSIALRAAGYLVAAGRGCAASHFATRSWTSSSSSVVMWVPTICRLAAYLSWFGPLTAAAKSSQ